MELESIEGSNGICSWHENGQLHQAVYPMSALYECEGGSVLDPFHNSSHPFWGFARVVAVLLALTVTLKATASNFDISELQVIGVMFLAVLGAEAVPNLFKKKE